jgi:hypothetical protein
VAFCSASAPFSFLLVFQIAVYPQGSISTRHRGLGDLDDPVFCELDLPRTSRGVPLHLLPTDGGRRSPDGLVSGTVRDKAPSQWQLTTARIIPSWPPEFAEELTALEPT